MAAKSGNYHDIYLVRDGKYITLKSDVVAFCEKYIKPVHPRNWDWSKRDFENPKNDPTIEEARVIRDLVYKDLKKNVATQIDLSTVVNANAILAFLNPKGKNEEFNMQQFAYALKVELEHGKLKDTNVTNNHPFLTAMIVLAHMSETVTYYERLKVMETEGEIFEITRKIQKTRGKAKEELYKQLADAELSLVDARKELAHRLDIMDEIPVLEEVGD
ncbi:hypothetical protein Q361_11436 [Flavobacterium croceum DSM 17960]|uniref:Uncharacterized protein n=1 Tax=Flavobacterium croceum DSM 17960 TaxID=1121886 RepID=A0A2S4N5Y3_9FLAO|nr:DUF5661 family protein [Flavobacterium croceum]POS01090.1 hypothetical protein Q361_11436 [Flavobacterium croceum DSM 17960]